MLTNPENLENPIIKLIDFDLASEHSQPNCDHAYNVMSPEVLSYCLDVKSGKNVNELSSGVGKNDIIFTK